MYTARKVKLVEMQTVRTVSFRTLMKQLYTQLDTIEDCSYINLGLGSGYIGYIKGDVLYYIVNCYVTHEALGYINSNDEFNYIIDIEQFLCNTNVTRLYLCPDKLVIKEY